MPDKTTYESEMNQPSHRPGMEKVVNRNQPMPIMQTRDKDGNQTQDARPSVAPGRTDPFSVKGDPAPAAEKPATPPAGEYSGFTGSERLQHVTDKVDEAAG